MIKTVEIEGFQAHQHTKIDLVPGVNVIVGETNAGKSSVLRAITWVASNWPQGDEFVSRYGGDVCRVTVTTERGVVVRERSKKFNGYRVTPDGGDELTFKDIRGAVPDEVTAVLDLRDVNMQQQFEKLFLLGMPPGQVSRYLSDLLGLEAVEAVVGTAKSAAAAARTESARLQSELESAEAELARLAYVDDVAKMVDEIDKDDSKLADLRRRRDELDSTARLVRDHYRSLKRARAVVEVAVPQDLLDRAAELESLWGQRTELSRALQAFRVARTTVEEVRERHTTLADKVKSTTDEYVQALVAAGLCPTCGGEVDRTAVERVLVGA